ncbi:hypothetical protein EVAR_27118_1 [Eumeta japonica]|uniref:Uncharacterized protein n=1 Tax=Eumeta variegata TaxID=151549 RepID=A0A4C1VZC8_EUMVA|nr:hypothetical protein EVAR_27118_1 [Eumeta japonica]
MAKTERLQFRYVRSRSSIRMSQAFHLKTTRCIFMKFGVQIRAVGPRRSRRGGGTLRQRRPPTALHKPVKVISAPRRPSPGAPLLRARCRDVLIGLCLRIRMCVDGEAARRRLGNIPIARGPFRGKDGA